MTKHHIAVLPGDGVGNEVIEATMVVLNALKFHAEYQYGEIGWSCWCNEGNPLPDRTIELLNNTDACLFGAITSKPPNEAENELSPELQNSGLSYTSPILTLRQIFKLYANVRPCKAYPGNPANLQQDIDLVVIRENTEGLYAGIEFNPLPNDLRHILQKNHQKMRAFDNIASEDIAVSLRVITRAGAYKIVQKAFDFAETFGYTSVTLAEKPNVLRETSGLMLEAGRNIANLYPNIKYSEKNIDSMAMWLVKNPQDYGVIVTSNLFGDILSDLSTQLVGGLGFASTANIGDNYAIFEPAHGSAPKYYGLNKVNPIAMLLSAKLMLDYLCEIESALKLESAIKRVISECKIKTYDMGGNNSTLDIAKAVSKYI